MKSFLPSALFLLQPNSTANVPSQVAIVSSLSISSSKPLVIVLGSRECLSLVRLLIDPKEYKLICMPRVPSPLRGLATFALSCFSIILSLEKSNVVVSTISPSLFPRGYNIIISGDGFGFANFPSWNANLSKRKPNTTINKYINLAPYSLEPTYEDFIIDNCRLSPSLVINNSTVHELIVSSINNSVSMAGSCFGCQSIDNFHDSSCALIALSAFSENFRIDLENEIQITLCRVKEIVQNDSIIFLKPHPFDSNVKVKLLVERLRNLYPMVFLVPDILPVEFLLAYAFKNFSYFKFLSFQQSALSCLLIDARRGLEALKFGFGRPLLEQFWGKEDMFSRLIYEDWVNSTIVSFTGSLDEA